MSNERRTKSEQLAEMKVLAKKYKSDYQKIEFFDNYLETFFRESDITDISLDENLPKEIDDAFYIYANMKRMNEEELNELQGLNWRKYPRNFKIFIFDFLF